MNYDFLLAIAKRGLTIWVVDRAGTVTTVKGFSGVSVYVENRVLSYSEFNNQFEPVTGS